MDQVVRTLIIILSCSACGGLVSLYARRRTGHMPFDAILGTLALFLYVIAIQASHYREPLSWYTWIALFAVTISHLSLLRRLKFTKSPRHPITNHWRRKDAS